MIPQAPIFSTYTGDGTTTSFNLAARVYLAADCQAYTYRPGVDVVPQLVTTGITWVVAGDYSGATATITPAPAAGVKVGLIRRMDLTQDINVSNTDYVPPSVIEKQLDRQVMMAQEAALFSTIGLDTDPFDFTKTARANMSPVFDANGNETYANILFPVMGSWSSATTYSYRQVVARNGSSYVCMTQANLNHDPATDNGTNWQTLASPDGMVSGPATSVAGHVATLANTTGNVLADGGAPPTLAVPSIAALRALVPAAGTVVLVCNAGGRNGTFIGDTTDLSGKVTLDTAQGIYIAPASAPTGASGAWVRTGSTFLPEHFGAAADGTTDDITALQAWANALKFVDAIQLAAKTYAFSSKITFPAVSRKAVVGPGPSACKLNYIGASTTSTLLTFGDAAVETREWNISGFKIGSSTTMTAGAAFELKYMSVVLIDNVPVGEQAYVSATSQICWDGHRYANCQGVYTTNSPPHVLNDAYQVYGNAADDRGSEVFLSHYTISNCATGVHIAGGMGGVYMNDQVHFGCGIGVLVDTTLVARYNREFFIGPAGVNDGSNVAGLYVDDPLSISGLTIDIAGFFASAGYFKQSPPTNFYHNIWIKNAPNAALMFSGGQSVNSYGAGLYVEDDTTNITISPSVIFRNNRAYAINGSKTIYKVSAPCMMYSNTPGNISSSINGDGFQKPWTSTLSSPGSTGFVGTATGRYFRWRGDLTLEADLVITNIGTGSPTHLEFTLPIAPQTNAYIGGANPVTGKAVYGAVAAPTQTISVKNADGTYPAITNSYITMRGTMEVPVAL